MRVIWKAKIKCNAVKDSSFPIMVDATEGAVPITVGKQGDDICVWFEVDPDAKPWTMVLYCIGTGFGRVPNGRTFLGTVIDGDYVWHLYY